MKTIYGSRVAELQSWSMGARWEVPSKLVSRYRCTATKLGFKLSIVERRGAITVLQRVAETRWGKIKALVCNLPIGGQITVQSANKVSFISCAQRVRVSMRTVSESNGLATLERTEPQIHRPAKPIIAGLQVGQTLTIPEFKRARSLCSTAYTHGMRVSRTKSPTGGYILTRIA